MANHIGSDEHTFYKIINYWFYIRVKQKRLFDVYLYLKMVFCRFIFQIPFQERSVQIKQKRFRTTHNKCKGKGRLVCKNILQNTKKSFCSRGVLEENSLGLNGDFGKVILYTNLR